MENNLISFLAEQPILQIIRGLITSPHPRHLRDLASQYGLSSAGVSDIIRRLTERGLLREEWQGNRRCFSLQITEDERRCLNQFFLLHEVEVVRRRATRLDKNAAAKLRHMDEMYSFYRKFKSK